MAWNPRKTVNQLSNTKKDMVQAASKGNLGKFSELSGREIQSQTSHTPVLSQIGKFAGGGASTYGQIMQSPGKTGGILKNLWSGASGVGTNQQKTFNPAEVNPEAFQQTQQQMGLQDQFAAALAGIGGRQAPTLGDATTINAAVIDQAKQAEFRNQQMALAQALQAQSMGQGPSLANQQLKMGTDRNLAQAMAMAGSMRGGNAAAGMRGLQNQTSMINQQAAQQAALTRMQEQMSAREQLGGVLNAGRVSDIGLATSQAGLNQSADLANQQAKNQFMIQSQNAGLQQQGLNDAMARFYQGGMVDQNQFGINSQQELERLRLQRELGMGQINAGIGANNQQMNSQLISGLGSAAAMYAMSDENVKTDIKSGDGKIMEFLNALKAHDYKYKESKHGEGRFVSPMAQELEKTEAGRAAVEETPEGKRVNYARIAGTMLAAQGHLNQRLNDLEAALKMKKAMRA